MKMAVRRGFQVYEAAAAAVGIVSKSVPLSPHVPHDSTHVPICIHLASLHFLVVLALLVLLCLSGQASSSSSSSGEEISVYN